MTDEKNRNAKDGVSGQCGMSGVPRPEVLRLGFYTFLVLISSLRRVLYHSNSKWDMETHSVPENTEKCDVRDLARRTRNKI